MTSSRAAIAALGVALLLAACSRDSQDGSSAAPATLPPSAVPTAVTLPPSSSPSSPPTASPAGAAASSDAEATLLAVGDIGRCDSTTDDETAQLAALLPGAIALLGDTAYPDGTEQQLRECFGGAWGASLDRIRFAVTGNHDVHTADGEPLRDYLGDAAARDGKPWFSETVGTWHVVMLSLECSTLPGGCGPGSPEVTWLRDDLARSGARCTLALWHEPRFSSGQHGNDERAAVLWDALYPAGADLVLNGHDHDYERFAPQDPGARPDPVAGITEIVAGTGGGELRSFGHAAANSMVRVEGTNGLVELTLGATGWASRFIAVDGEVVDEAHGSCH